MKIRAWLIGCSLLIFLLLLKAAMPTTAESPPEPQTKPEAAKVKPSYDKHIQPLLTKYCITYHGGARPKADFAMDKFKDATDAMKDRDMWQKVVKMVQAREMPPANKPQPTLDEQDVLVQWIDVEVNKIDCSLPPDPGQVTIRRLNKTEYNNTIRDLIGIDFQPAKDFPADDVGYGFDNIGDVLTLSPLLVEKYLEAADVIVEKAFKDEKLRKKIMVVEPPPPGKGKFGGRTAAAREIIGKFGYRAYRRPLRTEEVDRLLKFVNQARDNGDTFEVGIKVAVKAMLVSPNFLFRVEQDQVVPAGKMGHPISEFELASRLSYFLWTSMPDEELFRLAEKGELRKKGVLEQQVKRMMTDSKSDALVKNFAGQWLQLRKFQGMTPDPEVYPKFNEKLRAAMTRETEMFFEYIVREDRSILEFLDADYTFVNEQLAKHYGMPDVKGEEFRKIRWPDKKRGGILTQGSVLTLTSNPTRTSPVSRGKWVLENILNAPPPPPVPDAGELSQDKKVIESASLRQRLEMHRADPRCATCHQRMDPLGFGLENYDGVGSWREKDGKFPIDATGTLPTGQTFNGPGELRKILLQTKEKEFRSCLVEKMLTYALGRGLTYYDRCVVNEISQSVVKNDNRFSSLILSIVKSDPFQMRKGKKGG